MRFLLGFCSGVVLLLAVAGHPSVVGPEGAFSRATSALRAWLAPREEGLDPPRPIVAAEAAAASPSFPAASKRAAPLPEPPSAENASPALWPDDAPLPEAFGDAFAWWAKETGWSTNDPGSAPDPGSASGPVAEYEPDRSEGSRPQGPGVQPRVSAETSRPAMEHGAAGDPGSVLAIGSNPDRAVAAETSALGAIGSPDAPARGEEHPSPTTEQDTASVWIPFHSERSAAGFAQRLSRALEHPFDVRREGPGRYQVVFPYEDPTGRDEVLARVAMITGLQQ